MALQFRMGIRPEQRSGISAANSHFTVVVSRPMRLGAYRARPSAICRRAGLYVAITSFTKESCLILVTGLYIRTRTLNELLPMIWKSVGDNVLTLSFLSRCAAGCVHCMPGFLFGFMKYLPGFLLNSQASFLKKSFFP